MFFVFTIDPIENLKIVSPSWTGFAPPPLINVSNNPINRPDGTTSPVWLNTQNL
jgi:hypothetical protein